MFKDKYKNSAQQNDWTFRQFVNVYVNVKTVFTNTAPVDAYRGAGRPEATYSLERVIDKAATELGLDPTNLRRQNFIKSDQFPYVTAAGLNYDVGDYDAVMDRLEHHADLKGFAKRRKSSFQILIIVPKSLSGFYIYNFKIFTTTIEFKSKF